jgi:hypothetical protein
MNIFVFGIERYMFMYSTIARSRRICYSSSIFNLGLVVSVQFQIVNHDMLLTTYAIKTCVVRSNTRTKYSKNEAIIKPRVFARATVQSTETSNAFRIQTDIISNLN